MKKKRIVTSSIYSSKNELTKRKTLQKLLKSWPGPDDHKIKNLGIFTNRINLMRILFMNELYNKTLNTSGDIFEFGCRWGQNICLFLNFRGIYEPYNMLKKIVGFDTFKGFPSVSFKDKKGNKKVSKQGSFSTTKDYDIFLKQIMDYHSSESPAHHVKRHEIVKGDATKTIKKYLKDNPQTMIALAYFDMDIYKPTKVCLKAIKPHLTKGSILAFDEPNCKDFPGETIAIREVFGSLKFKLFQSKYSAGSGYLVIQ